MKADNTAPVITPSISGTSGNNGWYTSNVTISWSVVDAESAITSQTGCGTTTITADTTGTTLTCEATSSGGTASKSVTIKRDATPPTLNPSVTPNPVLLGGSAVASAGAADNLSGIASVSCGAVDTSSVGTTTVSCSATDNAGNTDSVTHGYRVVYDFAGFFAPVDNLPTVNVVKAGQAVPVKFSLGGDFGLAIFESGYPKSVRVACDSSAPQDAVTETVTAGSSSLSYDAATDRYSYAWKTEKAWANTCRVLTLKLSDGSEHVASFRFSK